MSTAEIKSLIDRYIDAYNRMDVEGMIALLHPRVQFRNIAAGKVNAETQGIDEFRILAQQSLQLFSERRQVVESLEVHGPSAVASIAFHAVAAVDLPNGLRRGQALSLTGRSEFEFQDGTIIRITDIS